MFGLFDGSDFDGNISQWNVSKVTDMSYIFCGSKFNGDISQWNISEDANIDKMFRGCALEKNGRIPNLKNFDVSGKPVIAKNKQHLKSLITLAISKYGPKVDLNFIDVSNVTNMSGLFDGSDFDGNISQWNVSKVTDMSHMFCDSKFNGDISQWNISDDANIDEMFIGCALEKNGRIPNLKNFDVSGKPVIAKNKQHLKSLITLAISKYGPKVDLNFIDVSNVTDMFGLFAGSDFDGNISQWNVSNVIDMGRMFCDSKFNGDISVWNVSKVTNMFEMFYDSDFNGDISNWNISSDTDTTDMFGGFLHSLCT